MYEMTQTHKRKIGEANKKGRFKKCSVCPKKFWVAPWEEARKTPKQCCSRECFKVRYKKLFAGKGSKNQFWSGGKWSYIKKQALLRDNYTCKCGFRDKEIMEVDHVKERKLGGKNTLENAQTLCPNCHARKTIKFLKGCNI